MFDPIEFDKVNRICHMTDEMHQAVTDIYESLSDGDSKSFHENLKKLKILTNLLIDSVNDEETDPS
jgi:hypothetical protein